jgi:Fe-S-cluster containining protein
MTSSARHPDLVAEWRRAAAAPEVGAELVSIFAGIAGEVAARAPSCWASGRCCHFERAGHRLYATGLETAYTLARLERPLSLSALDHAVASGGCPFQTRNLCTVHAIKPIGCRVYFCDTTLGAWAEELAERMHRRIAELHDRFDITYHYAEWRSMLALFVDTEPPSQP